jgi:expansin (peptidoglycan-binding protein)
MARIVPQYLLTDRSGGDAMPSSLAWSALRSLSPSPWVLLLGLLAGCGSSDSSGSTPQQPGTQPTFGSTSSGEGTYYGATGGGACSYDPTPQNLMVAAMNAPQWNNSAVCGMCVEVTGPKGAGSKIVVRIVDLCPECKSGDLDLSPEAFALIADPVAGRVKISWQPVACAVSGPLQYRFKEGSSQWWMGVQVRNSRLPISKLELSQSGFVGLTQSSYGYYIQSSPAPGPGPFTFRITAASGQQVVESGIQLGDATTVTGSQQF